MQNKINTTLFKQQEINKETFIKFKRVRKVQSPLYGECNLYSRNGCKYIGKELPKNLTFQSTRSSNFTIFKYHNQQSIIYLFPLIGQPLSSLMCKSRYDGEMMRWIQKCGSIQNCLWEVLKKILKVVEEYKVDEVILECFRIYNGQVYYFYDSWMKKSLKIVQEAQCEIQNYYFSSDQLNILKNKGLTNESTNNQLKLHQNKNICFKIFLMILHLGSFNLSQRIYQYGTFDYNQQNLNKRIEYFVIRHNTKGLGTLVKDILQHKSISMEEIWKITTPELVTEEKKRILKLKDTNRFTKSKEKRNLRIKSQLSDMTEFSPQKQLNCEQNKNQISSSYSKLLNNSQHSLKQNKLNYSVVCSDNNYKSMLRQSEQYERRSIKLLKDKKHQNKYQVTKLTQKLNLRQILIEQRQMPINKIKLLRYLGLDEWIPQNIYQEKVIQSLNSIHPQRQWKKQIYSNGSIYFGETKNAKKEGKGLYLFSSNDVYFGDWRNNLMHGYGTYIFASGQTYEGELVCGQKQGHGRCIYSDGRQYEGDWHQNQKIGLGKVKFPNQVTFVGLFKPEIKLTEGVFIGPFNDNGIALWQNHGILQHYNWMDNQMIANCLKYKDDLERKKMLKQCKSELFTEISDENGRYEGEIVDGKKHGLGIFQNGTEVYEGQWHKDKKSGNGILKMKDGFCIKGEFRNNVFIRYDYQVEDDII